MIFRPWLRKLALVAHVTASVGWFGAVAGFLALALTGLGDRDSQTLRACYIAMDVVTWTVIVPLGAAALLTGLVSSLGTTWGLFRHYWVLAKLLLSFAASALLLLHTHPIGLVARAAAQTSFSGADLRGCGCSWSSMRLWPCSSCW